MPAKWTDEQLSLAKSVDIVTFASPSAVRTWCEKVGNFNAVAVVIGPTSARAAEQAGYTKVFSPSAGSKGVEPWAKLINDVARELETQ